MSTSTLLESAAEVFRGMEIDYTVDTENQVIQFGLSLNDGNVEFFAFLDSEIHVHHLVIRFPIFSPNEHRVRSAEFACRYNMSVMKTALCFDPDTGRWHLRLLFNRDANGTLNLELFESAIHHLAQHADKLLPTILRLVTNHEKPATLMEQLEARLEDPDDDEPKEKTE